MSVAHSHSEYVWVSLTDAGMEVGKKIIAFSHVNLSNFLKQLTVLLCIPDFFSQGYASQTLSSYTYPDSHFPFTVWPSGLNTG